MNQGPQPEAQQACLASSLRHPLLTMSSARFESCGAPSSVSEFYLAQLSRTLNGWMDWGQIFISPREIDTQEVWDKTSDTCYTLQRDCQKEKVIAVFFSLSVPEYVNALH